MTGRSFITLFDSGYLVRGLAMYRSLERHAPGFRLTAVTFDDEASNILERLALPDLSVIPLAALETFDPALAAVRPHRTHGEYCWTATPDLPRIALSRDPSLMEITYLDADLLFFADPEPVFVELGDEATLITPHRYAPPYRRFERAGIYNVQFMTFRRDDRSLEALEWWRARCLEWCHARLEGGRYGDQKYLDDWPVRFAGVHVLQHPGAGVAPWNLEAHRLTGRPGEVLVDGHPLVFFHYHGFRPLLGGGYRTPAAYVLPPGVDELIYAPYARALGDALAEIRDVAPGFDRGFDPPPTARRELIDRARRLQARARKSLPFVS